MGDVVTAPIHRLQNPFHSKQMIFAQLGSNYRGEYCVLIV